MLITNPTDMRKLREAYGISVKELCEELNIAKGLYAVHESGKRKYPDERNEQFFYDVAQALARITKRRKEESQKEVSYRNYGLKLGDELLTAMVQDDSYEDDDDDIVYPPITEAIFKKAIHMLSYGFNTVQISVKLEICQLELEKRIGCVKSDFSVDSVLD